LEDHMMLLGNNASCSSLVIVFLGGPRFRYWSHSLRGPKDNKFQCLTVLSDNPSFRGVTGYRL